MSVGTDLTRALFLRSQIVKSLSSIVMGDVHSPRKKWRNLTTSSKRWKTSGIGLLGPGMRLEDNQVVNI